VRGNERKEKNAINNTSWFNTCRKRGGDPTFPRNGKNACRKKEKGAKEAPLRVAPPGIQRRGVTGKVQNNQSKTIRKKRIGGEEKPEAREEGGVGKRCEERQNTGSTHT